MYKYKTKDGNELLISGVGVTQNGVISSETPIENPNLELIEGGDQPSIIGTEAAQPNVVVDAQPVAPTEAPQPTQTNEDTN